VKLKRTLLLATLLTLACSLVATVAFATAGTGHARGASAPNTAEAHATAAHHAKHARATCHTTTHKRHRKHQRHCSTATRVGHGKGTRHSTTGVGANHSQTAGEVSGHQSRHSQSGAPSAKGAGHGNAQAARPVVISVASAATTIANVLATPCQNTELMPEAANLALVEQATLCLINQERARNNELPLQVNAQLTQVAQQHSEDMVAKDYFSHTTPSGETQFERVLASGYIPNSQVGYTVGENIAWGTLYLATPSSIVAAWIASPEHLENILTNAYVDTGIGIDPAAPASLAEGQPGAIYTQEFGVIQG
jgi:uncharacterized protein YkwD